MYLVQTFPPYHRQDADYFLIGQILIVKAQEKGFWVPGDSIGSSTQHEVKIKTVRLEKDDFAFKAGNNFALLRIKIPDCFIRFQQFFQPGQVFNPFPCICIIVNAHLQMQVGDISAKDIVIDICCAAASLKLVNIIQLS